MTDTNDPQFITDKQVVLDALRDKDEAEVVFRESCTERFESEDPTVPSYLHERKRYDVNDKHNLLLQRSGDFFRKWGTFAY